MPLQKTLSVGEKIILINLHRGIAYDGAVVQGVINALNNLKPDEIPTIPINIYPTIAVVIDRTEGTRNLGCGSFGDLRGLSIYSGSILKAVSSELEPIHAAKKLAEKFTYHEIGHALYPDGGELAADGFENSKTLKPKQPITWKQLLSERNM